MWFISFKGMHLFGETVDMKWELDASDKYNGHGYGIGEKHIFVGEFIHGAIWGDMFLFDRATGKKMLKVETEDNVAHGSYEYYHCGEVIERGVYRNGRKYFQTRLKDGRVYEYGFSRGDRLHGYGVTEWPLDGMGHRYTSPHWKDGVIDGIGCVQDHNMDVIFYGRFKNGWMVEETEEKHSSMLGLWKKAEKKQYYNIPYECAMACFN